MRIHTNIRQGNIGMIKSVPAWLLDYQLELTSEETELIQTYKDGEKILCRYTDDEGKEHYINVSQAVKGYKGHCFKQLYLAQTVQTLIIEGCGGLRDHMRSIMEIRSGGGEKVIEIPLYPQQ